MKIQIFVSEAPANITTYQEAIRFAGNILVEKGTVQSSYVDTCIDRETDFPTGLSLANDKAVAIPHGDSEFVNISSISILRLINPVEFGRMENKEQSVSCSFIFILALASSQQHINVLRKIVSFIQDDDFLNTCQVVNIEAAQELIEKKLVN